jgi:4-nitrophenyl phosphatase
MERGFWMMAGIKHNDAHNDIAIDRLRKIETFLLDLDGTFYLGDHILPGSLRFVEALQRTGRNFYFVTNNSSKNAAFYAEKISRMGVRISPQQVFTAGEATVYYIQSIGIRSGARLYVAGTKYLKEDFREAGYDPDWAVQPEAVILGFDTDFDYARLTQVCNLVRQGVPFIATHPDLNCPTPEGPVPDCGALTAAVVAATGVKPVVVGKPAEHMIEAFCAKYGKKRNTLAMVGDRLYTDIALGINAGIMSVLVLSGETTTDDLKTATYQPDLILSNLGAIADLLAQ